MDLYSVKTSPFCETLRDEYGRDAAYAVDAGFGFREYRDPYGFTVARSERSAFGRENLESLRGDFIGTRIQAAHGSDFLTGDGFPSAYSFNLSADENSFP